MKLDENDVVFQAHADVGVVSGGLDAVAQLSEVVGPELNLHLNKLLVPVSVAILFLTNLYIIARNTDIISLKKRCYKSCICSLHAVHVTSCSARQLNSSYPKNNQDCLKAEYIVYL
mgnify:FL=1